VKNQWIKTKLKLNLYLGMAKQCTKNQMNICKQREKKSGKLIIRDFFSRSKGQSFVKNQWIKVKLKLNLYLGIAKQFTKDQMNICKSRAKKVWKMIFFLSPRAIAL
jgi:hypothetical protein